VKPALRPEATPLIAARRLAAALLDEHEELTDAERIVITRALQHHLELAIRELAVVELEDVEATRPSVGSHGG
jgi:hypothetical protein